MAVQAIVRDFNQRTTGRSLGEITLFRALLDSLKAGAPNVLVEEYHGAGHQVRHHTVPAIGLGAQRCELSDLMLAVFHQDSSVPPRLTFLQAKYERGVFSKARPLGANYVQWSLLAGRPALQGCAKFAPPIDLLSGAVLPSIGTFGFFIETGTTIKQYDLMYSVAEALGPVHPPPAMRKHGKVQGLFLPYVLPSPGPPYAIVRRQIGAYEETVSASSLGLFLKELLALRVGSPLAVRGWDATGWLLTELQRLPGRLAGELSSRLADWVRHQDNGRRSRGGASPPTRSGDSALVPARSLVVLKSNADLNDSEGR